MKIDTRIAWAIREMQRRLGDKVSILEIAAAVNLSRSRFAHLFRVQTGVSPAHYLRDFRLERAKLLLETTSLSVREIMEAVGCHDASHFSRDFRRTYGLSPRNWRREHVGRPA